MPRHSETKVINRIIDANINRAKEGLRVCEEVTRFILNSRNFTSQLKTIRHKIEALSKQLFPAADLLKERNSLKDIGKNIYINELKRKNYRDVFFANIQRAKESLRVLEEFTKLKNTRICVEFKKIRYRLYGIEKKVAQKFPSLRYYR